MPATGLPCALFIAHYLRDMRAARVPELPRRYLRTPLTLGAVLT